MPRKGTPNNPICLGVTGLGSRMPFAFVGEVKMTFEALLKKISPTLKRITYKLNGHCAYFNNDDLFQEAVLHLWQDYNKG